jgi:preprotein translocase subunit SecG
MNVLRIILTILFALDSLVLTVVVLMQEGKSSGLGALSGASEGFWGQNKGRSAEGVLVLLTRIAAVLFVVLALALNLKWFK